MDYSRNNKGNTKTKDSQDDKTRQLLTIYATFKIWKKFESDREKNNNKHQQQQSTPWCLSHSLSQ
jgi:hypothetical protein